MRNRAFPNRGYAMVSLTVEMDLMKRTAVSHLTFSLIPFCFLHLLTNTVEKPFHQLGTFWPLKMCQSDTLCASSEPLSGRGGTRRFPTGVYTSTRGLKHGFQGTINAKTFRKE